MTSTHVEPPKWLVDWCQRQFGKKVSASWWGWLKGKRAPSGVLSPMPGDDHVEYRTTRTKKFRISHPYGLAWDELSALVHFCEANGLKAQIDARSEYYYGSTIAVIVESKDQAV